MSTEYNEGSGRAAGRARGRARGRGGDDPSEASSGQQQSSGRGRGPSGDHLLNDGVNFGRGTRRGMERGRATLDEVEEIDARLQNIQLAKAGEYKPPQRIGGTQPNQVMYDDQIDCVDPELPDNQQVSKSGFHVQSKGTKDMVPIKLQTNVLFLQCRPNWKLYSYRVDFRPELEDKRQKKYVIKQHADEFGGNNKYIFDGTKLWTMEAVHENYGVDAPGGHFRMEPVKLQDETVVKIRLKYLEEQDETNPIAMQIYNLHLKNFQEYLKMTEFKRNFYFADKAKTCETGGHKFQVWPGMVARINRFEKKRLNEDGTINYYDMPGMLLDTTSKVVRQQSCYEVIKAHKRNNKSSVEEFKKACKKDLVGSTILTLYNKENYRIDDIDFENSPSSRFDKRGVETSYVEYYKTQHNITIKDVKQPLFICRPKKKIQGEKRNICLIPELCMPTGLTDNMRTDFKIMRDLAQFTRLSPDDRYKRYASVNQMFKENDQIKAAMKSWGIRFEKEGFAKADGFKCRAQDITMNKRGQTTVVQKGDEKADWDRALKSSQLLVAPEPLERWIVFANKKAEKEVTEFVKAIMKLAKDSGWAMSKPKIELVDDKALVKSVRSSVESGIQFCFCFVPRERKDHYDAVKKICLQAGISSQFVKERTIKKNMQAVAVKVELQMACKFGGEAWTVAMPPSIKDHNNKPRPIMYIGIDVYHDTAKKNDSVYALVGSLNPKCTRWYSTHLILAQTEETPGHAVKQMIKLALGAYKHHNGYMPGNIIVYRDGVGDTDLPRVKYQEIDAITAELRNIEQNDCDEDQKINMTFCVVQKRIDHKILAIKGNTCENPPAGTVVDTVITKNIWYDFFLVSQQTRQGTVTPIHINVLYDTVGLPTDKLQLLTFKLCHLYFNWPGTVRVPAPVQYAHKYAQLIGDSVHAGVEVEASLKDKLFYL